MILNASSLFCIVFLTNSENSPISAESNLKSVKASSNEIDHIDIFISPLGSIALWVSMSPTEQETHLQLPSDPTQGSNKTFWAGINPDEQHPMRGVVDEKTLSEIFGSFLPIRFRADL